MLRLLLNIIFKKVKCNNFDDPLLSFILFYIYSLFYIIFYSTVCYLQNLPIDFSCSSLCLLHNVIT